MKGKNKKETFIIFTVILAILFVIIVWTLFHGKQDISPDVSAESSAKQEEQLRETGENDISRAADDTGKSGSTGETGHTGDPDTDPADNDTPFDPDDTASSANETISGNSTDTTYENTDDNDASHKEPENQNPGTASAPEWSNDY